MVNLDVSQNLAQGPGGGEEFVERFFFIIEN